MAKPAAPVQAQDMAGQDAFVQETLDAMYKYAIAKFRGAVHVRPVQAYKNLIKEIKEASTSFVTDLSNANEDEVFAAIHNPTGLYFITDVVFKQKIARERESVEREYQHKWNEEVSDLVEHLHHNAAETAHYLHNMHVILAMIKPKVSDADYMKILSSVTLPMTTVEVVQYVDKFAGVGVDADRIRNHMPQPKKFQGRDKATSLFACLVHYIMRNNFVNVQKHQLGYDGCAKLFGVSVSALRRVFTGHVRKGGREYHKERAKKADKDSAKQAAKQEEKRVTAAASTSDLPKDEDDQIVCKYCGKTFDSEDRFTAHIKRHFDQVRFYDCIYCSKQFELFTELMEHLNTHVEKKYVCYVCKQACSSPHQLAVHAKTHKFSCQICPKSLPTKQQLDHHMGISHGTPVQVFQCSVCTYICTEKAVFYAHFNKDHRELDCNFCPRKFKLQSQLDEHVTRHHTEVTVVDTIDMAVVAPQMAPVAPKQPAPVDASISTDSVPAPDSSSVDPTADSTDLSTVTDPTLDSTGTDTPEGGRNPSSRENKICQACFMFFENNDLRVEHIKIYHRDLVVCCRFCHKIRFALTMDQHVAVSHAVCSACTKSFANHKLLKAHHKECKFSRPNVTTTDTDITLDPAPAASSTPRPGDEEGHTVQGIQQEATGSPCRPCRPHVCNVCKKGFDTAAAVNMHKDQKHKVKVVLTLCPECNKSFSSLASMQQHYDMKHKLKEFHCDIADCDYFSNSQEQLDHHRRRNHRATFKFRCSKCHFVSVTSEELGQHSATVHSTVYLPPRENLEQLCFLCHQKFSTWALYFAHIRTHPQNKHACDECPFVFSSPRMLNSHCVLAHDTRHFACLYCTEDFPNNDLLFYHTIKHQIQCSICYEYVLTEDDLNQHMLKKHKKELTRKQNEEMEEEKRREVEKQRRHDKRERDRKRRRREAKQKRKKQRLEEEAEDDEDDDDDDEEYDDSTYTPGGDDSEKDPSYRPSKEERQAARDED